MNDQNPDTKFFGRAKWKRLTIKSKKKAEVNFSSNISTSSQQKTKRKHIPDELKENKIYKDGEIETEIENSTSSDNHDNL